MRCPGRGRRGDRTSDDHDEHSRAFAWEGDGWQEIAAPPNVFAAMEVWPWGDGVIVAGAGVQRAMLYDPAGDQWLPTPEDVALHSHWESGLSGYVQASAPLGPEQLFVLATTAGSHPEIGQQGVAARLDLGATVWEGGSPGPFLGDVGTAEARGFAPGWVLVAGEAWGDVYDAASDAWCRTKDTPSPAVGAVVVLEDGSLLFTGSAVPGEVPLRWVAW